MIKVFTNKRHDFYLRIDPYSGKLEHNIVLTGSNPPPLGYKDMSYILSVKGYTNTDESVKFADVAEKYKEDVRRGSIMYHIKDVKRYILDNATFEKFVTQDQLTECYKILGMLEREIASKEKN